MLAPAVLASRELVDLHITDTAHASFDDVDMGFDRLFGHADLDAEHELFALALRLDLLWGELGLGRHETHIASEGAARQSV